MLLVYIDSDRGLFDVDGQASTPIQFRSARHQGISLNRCLPQIHMYLTEDRIRNLFKSLDNEERGYIDHDSIITNAYPKSSDGRHHRKFREMYATELLEKCDTNKNGKITYEDFKIFLEEKELELWNLFNSIDLKAHGRLTRDGVKDALNRAGVKISDGELCTFFEHIDSDNNGDIGFDDWARFLLFLPRNATMKNVYTFYRNLVHQTDSSETIFIPEERSSDIVTFKYLIAGALAGSISRTCTAPLDRLRILLQVQIKAQNIVLPKYFSDRFAVRLRETINVCKKIYFDGGITAFWRGNGVNVIKIGPESAVRFYIFESSKRWLRRLRGDNYAQATLMSSQKPKTSDIKSIHITSNEISMKERMIAGGIAGFASQAFIYPLDTIKTRMMAEINSSPSESGRTRVSAIAMAKKMFANEGFRPFFRGVVPSLIGIIPYASIDLTAYETFKSWYMNYSHEKRPSPLVHLACGALAGGLSATCVYPLGLIRTRLQAQGTSSHQQMYPGGAKDVIKSTFQRESFRGFYRGLVPSLIKVVPAVSISYICYEQAKLQLGLI